MDCKLCKKTFDTKKTLIRHYYYHSEKNINQKEKILSFISDLRKKGDFKCQICSNLFKTQKSLNDHLSGVCRPNSLNSLYTGMTKLKILIEKECKENSELLNLSSDLIDQLTKISNKEEKLELNINNNGISVGNIYGDQNTLNNINNVVKVRSVNQYPIDMYSTPLENKEKIMEIFRDEGARNSVDQMFLSIDKYFNCNPDFPENHNILVTNAKKYAPCMVKENDEWVKKQGADVKKLFYDRIVDCNELYSSYIPNKLKEFFPKMDPDKIDNMTDHIQDQYQDQSEKIKERLWYQFFLQAYNHREIMSDTYQKDMARIKYDIEHPPKNIRIKAT